MSSSKLQLKSKPNPGFEFVNARILSVLEKVEEIIKPDDKAGISEAKIESLKEIIKKYDRIRGEIVKGHITEDGIGVSLVEAEFDTELLKSLIFIFEYINSVSHDAGMLAEKGSTANNQLTRFLIGLSDKFNLPEEDLVYFYFKLFQSEPVVKELVNIGEERRFARGVYGVARSLSFLKTQKEFFQSKFHEPSLEEDMKHKVDLRCESETEISLFQIKAYSDRDIVVVYDLSSKKERGDLIEIFRSNDRRDLEKDIEA